MLVRWLRHPRKVIRHHTAIGFIRPSVETANDSPNVVKLTCITWY